MKIIRQGNYTIGFKYYKNNLEITNNDEIERIKLLKIPPAYNNVTIINNKKIIAYGYDSKNRKQVLYNPDFIAKQNIKKYDKISASIKFFSKLKKKIATDLNSSNEKIKAIAIIITLIFTCGFRIGNKKYEKENNSVGLTTLKYKHLKFEGSRILIDFIGKKGVRNNAYCDNRKIFEYLDNKFKISAMEDYIFSYGTNKIITSNDVNEYLKEICNYYSKSNKFIITTKDLRTWNANMLFLNYYKKIRKDREKNAKKQNNDKKQKNADNDNERCVKKDIRTAIEMVAEKLHNTYNICKKSYIDPKIVENICKLNEY
jgi:DNA topoisomerase-1